jgi:antitoxin component of MazEF toxin-antitoxin module
MDKMVKETKTKMYKVGSRHTIYLPKDFINDSTFPFRPGEELVITIENNKLIVERPMKKK